MTIGYHLYKSRLLVRVKQRRLWVRILAAGCARVMFHLHPPDRQRAQGKPGARCTRGLACICAQKARTRAYRSSGEHPAFPAQWLYGLLRALPGERLFCHRRRMDIALDPKDRCATTQLDASTAASGPHDFAVHSSRTRQSQLSRPPHLTARS